jgi:hypothetical protein
MKRALISGLLLAGMLSAPVYAQAMEKSLYQRLGGYNAISAVVNELAVRLVTDEKRDCGKEIKPLAGSPRGTYIFSLMKELELEKLFPYAENSFKEELVRFSQPVSLKKGTMVGYPGAVCELVP